MKFAAGDGQSKKRAASMDGKEFIAVLEYLKLLSVSSYSSSSLFGVCCKI